MSSNTAASSKKSLAANWITLFGFLMAIIFLVIETIVISLDIIHGTENAYIGILIYMIGPSFLVLSLLLVPFGMWMEKRRRLRQGDGPHPNVIDLDNPRHQRYVIIFSVVSTIFLLLTLVGTYQAYHITESNQFCGMVCHQVMYPEYTAYQNSPHARVNCVQCHIGPGAGWFVKSKLSGAWQVYAVATNAYELPIDTPIHNLRPARDTCEQCHWPEKFYESVEKQLTFYGPDEENTPYRVDLLLNVGPNVHDEQKSPAIHWHIGLDHKLEYYASDDDRQEIPWVRVTYQDGRVEEYIDSEAKDFDPAKIPADQIRSMDCIDCHNRPSHQYNSPMTAVNRAMDTDKLDPKLPGLKDTLVSAFKDEYKTTEEALTSIEQKLNEQYSDTVSENTELKASYEQAVVEAKNLYKQNFFPEWKSNWTQYPSNIGHFEFPGCYRCHDDNHKSTSGKTISNSCNLCHTIVRQGEGWDAMDNMEYKEQEFVHPRDLGDLWVGQNCHECHGPDAQ